MTRFRDFGGEVEVDRVLFEDGAVRLFEPSYRQASELDALKKELESYLAPTRIEYATVSTIVNERFAIAYGQTVVGELTIMDRASLGLWVDPKLSGRGIAFKVLKLLVDNYQVYSQYRAYVLPSNTAIKKSLEKVGFINQGVSVEKFYVDGQWQEHEEYIYTIKK